MPDQGTYIYCFVRSNTKLDSDLTGIDGSVVYTISSNGVAAVVSDCHSYKLRPERKNLSAHNEVIKEMLKENTILPVSFGIIADSRKNIENILLLNNETLTQQLKRLEGTVEMGLKVIWDVENIFQFMVRKHHGLELYRDSIFLKPNGPTRDEKMELGKMFELILRQDREKHTESVKKILKDYCSEIKENKPKDETTVMALACLVEKTKLKSFEEGVFNAAKVFDNDYAFDFNGPWAPYNFVNMNLKMA